MRLVAGEAGDGRGVLVQGGVGASDRMSFDGVVELVSLIEVQVEPGIHFLERDYGTPRKREGVRLAIHLHETPDVASHADILRRGVQKCRKVTRVGRVTENAVAILVGRMLNGVSGQRVASKAELIGRSGEIDVSRAFDIGHRVAGSAARRNRSVDVLPRGHLLVALDTFGRINICGEKDGMRMNIGAGSRNESQQNRKNSQCGEKKGTAERVRYE
jgi:hypothetical protein